MPRPIRSSLVVLALLTFLASAGCSDASPRGTVNGTVTLDGQPLKEGYVRFVRADGKSQPATADVVDGKFSAAVPLGEMRVEFSAPKIVGHHKMYDTPDSPTVDDVDELLPARYNVQSALKITVKKGSQDETFRLTSH